MGIMLVYDVTNEKSFDNIKNWIRNIEENASADVEKMLLGNKCELNLARQVNVTINRLFNLYYTINLLKNNYFLMYHKKFNYNIKNMLLKNFFH